MITTLVLLAAVVFYLNYSNEVTPQLDQQTASLFRYLLIALVPAGMAMGYFIYGNQVKTIDPSATLGSKINRMQAAILVRSACLEVPGILGCIVAMMSGDNSFLLFTMIVLVVYGLWRPTPDTLSEDLHLSQEERERLQDPEGLIE
jgi:hypothetical protein